MPTSFLQMGNKGADGTRQIMVKCSPRTQGYSPAFRRAELWLRRRFERSGRSMPSIFDEATRAATRLLHTGNRRSHPTRRNRPIGSPAITNRTCFADTAVAKRCTSVRNPAPALLTGVTSRITDRPITRSAACRKNFLSRLRFSSCRELKSRSGTVTTVVCRSDNNRKYLFMIAFRIRSFRSGQSCFGRQASGIGSPSNPTGRMSRTFLITRNQPSEPAKKSAILSGATINFSFPNIGVGTLVGRLIDEASTTV